MQLNDKVIIITGGCQGLGRSMAEYFAGKGAKLADAGNALRAARHKSRPQTRQVRPLGQGMKHADPFRIGPDGRRIGIRTPLDRAEALPAIVHRHRIEVRVVAADDAAFLQPSHALGAGGLAQSDAAGELERLHAELGALRTPDWKGETVLAVREEKSPRPTHVMLRGNPHSLGDLVEPGDCPDEVRGPQREAVFTTRTTSP